MTNQRAPRAGSVSTDDDYIVQLAGAITTLRRSAQCISFRDQEAMRAAAARIQDLEHDLARCRATSPKGMRAKLGVLAERLRHGGAQKLLASVMRDLRATAKG